MRYRPELDGLRAIAVIAVVATHMGLPGSAGGFLGVDVFFVLSGYLIFSDLAARPQGDGLAFYGRRARRILPAYYVALAVTLAGAAAIMMPGDLTQTARNLVAAALFVPNVLFLTQSGYFDPPASFNPLLHTWSLGVEVQFYLLAPLFALWLRRREGKARDRLLLWLAVAGFALCLGIRALGQSAAFFLVPARLWEFLLGGLAASSLFPRIEARGLRELLAAFGLAALLASLVLFTNATPHPSWPTLVPCIGTALVILATGSGPSLTGRLLGTRIPVFFGAISYSLYLWHWPLIVFAHYAQVPFTPLNMALGFGLLVVVSILTLRFVETPFRRGAFRAAKPGFAALAFASLVLIAATASVLLTRGFPHRFPADVAAVADYYDFGDRKPYREGQCFLTSRQSLSDFDAAACLKLKPDAKNVLIFGDSHAAHLWKGLQRAWPEVNFLQATASGCKPSLDPQGASRCTGLETMIERDFLRNHHIDGIIVAALWEESDMATLRALLPALKKEVADVTLIGPMPRYDQPAAGLLAQSMLRGDPVPIMAAHRLASVPALDTEMASLFSNEVHYVSLYRALCPDDKCLLFAAPGVPMQFDYHHLTDQGGALLATMLKSSKALSF